MAQDIAELRAAHRRDYDPYATSSIQEHLDELAERRREEPVSWSQRGNGCWVLTRYDDISSVLRRNNRGFVSFPNDPDGLNVQGARDALIPIEIDGERHRQFRRVLDPLFSPARVAPLEPLLREAATRLIDEFVEDGRCEFVEAFAMPFPGATFLAIMGWPAGDLHRLNRWVATMHHGVPGAGEEESNAARAQAGSQMRDYVVERIAERRADPRDDVTTHVLDAEIEGRRLTDDELFDLFLLMMLAGLDTVQSVLAQSFVLFGRQPELWSAMFADPQTFEPAIEELLRWTAPAIPTRTVTDDVVEVGGLELPRGERVHAPLAAANRDPEYYPDPDAVVFDRPAKPHLAFGMGTHRCLGVHLARLELRVAFDELHRRIPAFALAPGAAPAEHLGLSWGVEDVRIEFPPGSREPRS